MSVDAYRTAQRKIAERSRARVLHFLATLTTAEFAALAARIIETHRAGAVAIADVALAEHLGALPVGVSPVVRPLAARSRSDYGLALRNVA